MADDTLNETQENGESGESADVSTLDALHLDGKGLPGLDDAEEQSLPDTSEVEGDDVKGFANVQSANRVTFEQMQQGAPPQEGAAPVGDNVVADPYVPSEPDNSVEARFLNPMPPMAGIPEPAEAEARRPERPEEPRQEAPILRERPVEDALPDEGQRDSAPAGGQAETPAETVTVPPVEDTDPLPVETDPQAALLVVEPASGIENQLTKLTITAATNDTDGGGDVISAIAISGLPDYFEIVDAGGNAIGSRAGDTWLFNTPNVTDFDNIYLKNVDTDDDADFSGALNLTVSVSTTEPDGQTAITSSVLAVTITAVADTPDPVVADSAGMENSWIALSIDVGSKDSQTEAGPGVNAAETQKVYVAGLPDGARLDHGYALDADLTLEDGTIMTAGTWVVDATDLGDLHVRRADTESDDFTLTVRVASTEGSNGDTALSAPLTIRVDVGIVDPTAAGSGTGNEDDWAALEMSATIQLKDGAETLKVYIEDLPDGVLLADGDGNLTGEPYGGGVRYDVTEYWDAATSRINGLKVAWDKDSSAIYRHLDTDIGFNLHAVVTDPDAGDAMFATPITDGVAPDSSDVIVPVAVKILAVADTPSIAASAIGVEDKWFGLDITSSLADTDLSETLTVTVTAPVGVELRHSATEVPFTGTVSGNAVTYRVAAGDLGHLQLKGAQDSDADFNLTITAIATEGAGDDQVAVRDASASVVVNVTLLSDADRPTVTVVPDVQQVAEDGFFDLRSVLAAQPSGFSGDAVDGRSTETGSVGGDTDSGDHSETLSYRVYPQEAGFRVSHFDTAQNTWVVLGDGDLSHDYWEFSAADVLAGHVKVGGAADWASQNAADVIQFKITTVATETHGSVAEQAGGATDDALAASLTGGLTRASVSESVPATLSLYIAPNLDPASVGAGNAGVEDQEVELHQGRIAVTPTVVFTDADGSEIPLLTGANGADAMVTLSSTDLDMVSGDLYLDGSLLAPSSVTYDGAGTAIAKTWQVPADHLSRSAGDASGNTWVMGGLTFESERHLAGTASYSISLGVYDTQTGTTGTLTGAGAIEIAAIADTPSVVANDVNVTETAGVQYVGLTITPTIVDADGSETVSVYVTNVPSGVTLTDAAGTAYATIGATTVDGVAIPAGSYKLSVAELSGLQAKIPAGYSDDFDLTIYSATVETTVGQSVASGQGVAISAADTLSVGIGVIDPTITGNAVGGNEDSYLSLSGINVVDGASDSAPHNTDTLTVSVEGLTGGFKLYQASGSSYTQLTPNADGSYTIPGNLIVNGAMSGVYVKGAANSDANASFTLRAVTRDVDVGTATEDAFGTPYQDTGITTRDVTVTVKAVADRPNAPAVNAVGVEDKWVNLNLSAALKDVDGSENLTVTITGVPVGMVLTCTNSGGLSATDTVDANGTVTATTWTIGPAETNAEMQGWLANLRITGLAANNDYDHPSSTEFTITVTAKAAEEAVGAAEVATATASNATSVKVAIYGDADTPLVTVIEGAGEPNAVEINEDAFYNLANALRGQSGEAGSVLGAATSLDGSESLSFRITATESSRIWVDADNDGAFDSGEVTTLSAGQSVTVSAADVIAGKIHVGGLANWAQVDDDDTIAFQITPIATEADGDTAAERAAVTTALNTSNTFDGNASNNLSRNASTEGATKPFYLHINPVADETYIAADPHGVEDQPGGIAIAPAFTLTDTDGSESLTGDVEILVAVDVDGHYGGTLSYGGEGAMVAGDTVTLADGQAYKIFKISVDDLETTDDISYQLDNLVFIPDQHSDIDLDYRIRVTTADGGSTYATLTSRATLVVEAVADAPDLAVGTGADVNGIVTVSGNEDSVIPLDLTARLQDRDGSETLSHAELRNVPDGWTVAYYQGDTRIGIADKGATPDAEGDYTWGLDLAHLSPGSAIKVALIPPAHSDADANGIVFWAKTLEDTLNDADADDQVSRAEAESTLTFNVAVNAVADTPTLLVSNARVIEDHSVALDIRAALTDTDPSETLSLRIAGVPAGGGFTSVDADGHTVTAGQQVSTAADGTTVWSFSNAEIASLAFVPAHDSNVDATLTITAIATDRETDGTGVTTDNVASKSVTIQVVVSGESDGAAILTIDDQGRTIRTPITALTASGTEDALINPHFEQYGVADTDTDAGRTNSETLSIVLSGIPEGVGMVMAPTDAGADTSRFLKYIGTDTDNSAMWSVAPDYVKYVRFQVPGNYAGTFPVTTKLITTEDDGHSTVVKTTLAVTVNPAADTPSGWVTTSVLEDSWLDGAGVDAGIPITFTASVADTGGGNNAIGNGVAETITDVDATIDVTELVTAKLAAGGESSDVYLTYGTTTYTPVQVGATWTITVGDIAVSPSATVNIGGLTLFGVPADWSDDVAVTLNVTATDTLRDAQGNVVSSSTTTQPIPTSIRIVEDADAPTLSIDLAHSDLDASGGDRTATLTGTFSVNDTDGSESMYLVVSGIPNGVIVTGGINSGGGTWIVPTTDGTLDSIQFVSSSSAGPKLVTIKGLVVDTDPDTRQTDTASAETSVMVDFGTDSGGPGEPEIIPVVAVTGPLGGAEDGSLNLSALSFSITHTDGDGTTTYSHTGASVYDGSTLVGTLSVVVRPPAGWSLSGNAYWDADAGAYTVPYSALGTVQVKPPADYAGSDYDLDIRAVVTTTSGRYDETAGSNFTDIPVTVTPETDGAAIAIGIATTFDGNVHNGTAYEDTDSAITLTISARDVDFSEDLSTGTVTIRVSSGSLGIADTDLAAGSSWVDNGGGLYTLSLGTTQIAEFADSADGRVVLSGLVFSPETDYSGPVTLSVETKVTDTGTDEETSSASTTFTVNAVIDDTQITAVSVNGDEDVSTGIALDVTLTHSDLVDSGAAHSSESISVVISGVPAGAVIDGAYNNGNNTWTVKAANLVYDADSQAYALSGVYFKPAQDDSGDYTLTVKTYAREDGAMTIATASASFTVSVDAVTDGITLNPQNALNGTEDVVQALDLGIQLQDAAGTSEHVTGITLGGVPAGASFQDAGGDPIGTRATTPSADGTFVWTLSEQEITGLDLLNGGQLYFVGPHDVAAAWTMTATATTVDLDTATDANPVTGAVVTSNVLSFTVSLAGLADTPDLAVTATASGIEDALIPLDIRAALTDVDSESLTLTLTGAPPGTIFWVATGTDGAGQTVWSPTYDNNGSWVISGGTLDAIDGVRMQTPRDYNGTVTLNVAASSGEGATTATDAHTHAGTPLTVTVTVAAVNDAPTIDVTSGAGIGAGTHDSPILVLVDMPGVTNEITIGDVDNSSLAKMTLTIGGPGAAGTDSLALSGLDVSLGADGLVAILADGTQVGISYDQATRTLTFTGPASPAQFQALAFNVALTSTTHSLAAGERTVTLAVYDGAGAVGSDEVTVTVTGTAILTGAALGEVSFAADNAPLLSAGSLSTIEDGGAIALALDMAGVAAADLPVAITGCPAGTVFLTLAGDSIVADADGAQLTAGQLTGLQMALPENWNGATTLTVTATAPSAILSETVAVSATAVNDAPEAALNHASQDVPSGARAQPVSVLPDGMVVSDADGTTLNGMVVTIADGAEIGDSLALSGIDIALDGNGNLVVAGTAIGVSYDGANHALTFSGTASHATYAEVAAGVVLSNSSGTLDAGLRTFSVTLYDGQGAQGEVETTANVGADGPATQLSGAALGEVRWSDDGAAVLGGEDVMILHSGDPVRFIDGGMGSDTLMMQHADGTAGDWLFEIQDGTVIASSGTDKDFVVELDQGSATKDTNGDIVFNGDASGRIVFEDQSSLQFDNLDRLVG